ncbi:cytochrome c oxidase assembly protein [Aquibium sp. LZ166]|uniref:Cytochrome c oxidase assembly protein n=1 Tax=Aquibium pacificus TaxID=3153579 RepID=A0ABV3SFS0_9HYPH
MLTEHMLEHIVAMNVVAPFAVLAGRGFFMHRASPSRWLGVAIVLQIVLLWGWHMPAGLTFAVRNPAALLAMHLSLFAAALLFWAAVIDAAGTRAWGALSALLVTAKLSCLLGALFTFAPRPLYAGYLASNGIQTDGSALEDQHVAGLLMLTAYTFSYIGAAVVIVARWLSEVEKAPSWHDGPA